MKHHYTNFKKFEIDYMIRETHLDVFGHVNNANYLKIYEESRWDVITAHGYGLKDIYEKQVGPIILSLKMDYRKELKARDEIKVTVQILNYKGKIGTLKQEMIKQNGDIASSAEYVMGLFDLKQRKLIAPTKKWLTALGCQEL